MIYANAELEDWQGFPASATASVDMVNPFIPLLA
jgi:hypothetical protein